MSTKEESLRVVEKCGSYYVESLVKGEVVLTCGPFSESEAMYFKSMDHAKRRRYKKKLMIQNAKNKPCSDCQCQFSADLMTFDHVRGKKYFDLADASKKSWDALYGELDKCEVVCRSCHNIREYMRGKVARLNSTLDLASFLLMTLESQSPKIT